MVERADWKGILAGRRQGRPGLQVVMPLATSPSGASGSFLARASNRRRYWVKVPGEHVNQRMIAAEQVVGRIGALIGAPTCAVVTVSIPEGLRFEYRKGQVVPSGVAHASVHVENAVESRSLDRPAEDDNARRYTGFAALYDWAWGDDVQGLYALSDEWRFYSHDHGWYLPPGRGAWHAKAVEDYVDTPHVLEGVTLHPDEAERVAGRLMGLTRGDIAHALVHVPVEWVGDSELESVGFYLEHRAPQVAARLKANVGGRT